MATNQLEISPAAQDDFEAFISDKSLLALPLSLKDRTLRSLPVVHSRDVDFPTQISLNLLDDLLSPTRSLYLLLRRSNSIFAITFVPDRASKDEREFYLQYRHDLVRMLGEEYFKVSLICKEIGEITDERSWVERQKHREENTEGEHKDVCDDLHEGHSGCVEDLGHKKNKCRLCDRRMKNKITEEAFAALNNLERGGDLVQISLDADLVLALDLQSTFLQPKHVPSHLRRTHPTFTLYRHPNKLLFFIFHSPDSATVQQRMKHTMAIPGLVNVHAEDSGVHVDQKIEIHEPEDLIFEEGDAKVGKFRSVYLRGGWQDTESQYDGLERDLEFYNAVR